MGITQKSLHKVRYSQKIDTILAPTLQYTLL